MGYEDGTKPCQFEFTKCTTTNETIRNFAYDEWHKMDQLLLSWIFTTLSDEVHISVEGFSTSYKAWTTLKNIYAAIQNVKKRSKLVSEYFAKARGVFHQAALASKTSRR